MGLVTTSQNNSPTVLAQNNDEVESLVSQLENVDCELKNIKLPLEETRSANPPAINPILNSPKKVAKSIIGPKDPLHNNTFLSKLVEIDMGLSNLKAGPSTINDPLNADILINEHVITEEANEAARVSPVQGAVTHVSTRAAKTETQNTQPLRQQGSWKRLNKADAPSKTDRITSTVESVLSTKRVYEELSHSNVAIEAVVWFCCGRKIFKSQWKIHQSIVLMYLLRRIHLKNGVSQVSMVNQ